MKLISSAFENNDTIPVIYTCEGENISPPLSWSGVPEQVETLALVMDDPDAPDGTFVHWVVYNLPPVPPNLEEGASLSERLSEGLREGANDSGEQGYGGPCPPRGGGEHRYFFRLYAIDRELNLTGRVTRDQLMDAIEGKTLDEAELVGRFSRE
ncbi:MAG: YbhB/YbcL family Raf kinase inhibitor-like protein [Brevefilum sp.]